MEVDMNEEYVPALADLAEFARAQRDNPNEGWPTGLRVPDNMDGADLRGIRFPVPLHGKSVQGALLQGASIPGMHLVKACGANLSGAHLGDISASDLCGADLTGAVLKGRLDATLSGAIGVRQYGPVGRRGRFITGIAPLNPADEPMIRGGHRWETLSAALLRIEAEYEGHPLRDEYIRAIYLVGGRQPVDLLPSSLEISQTLLWAAEKAHAGATQALVETKAQLAEARERANALRERLDRARLNFGKIIQRAMQRGDMEEVANLHREMRQI